ncbi:MAG: HAMP domain-containing histidine kinase [Verrucomicrobiota bacterium]|nr:HAMP domain-containing histidine kinase [Verrucomicrobiota bacterium]
MNAAAESRTFGIRRFRSKLLVAMMLVISSLTVLGIVVAQRRAADEARADLQRDFELELASLHRLQDLRNAAVADRSKALAQNARIHAALEDNALDLLYPSAHDELRDLMGPVAPDQVDNAESLHARFYRFLDSHGAVIPPPGDDAGLLLPNEEARLAQPRLAPTLQIGYFARRDEAGRSTVDEMIAVPIRSTETNEVIAALVLGFKPVETVPHGESIGMKSGILVDGELQLTEFDQAAEDQVAREVAHDLAHPSQHESLRTTIGGVPHLLFYKKLNLDSDYPPAYEVCVYPLDQLLARQARLRWQILSAGGLLLVGGFVVSHFVSRRLSRPVEALAVVSEENFTQRQRAEAELQTTSDELQRSARFSANASHQLKSPITVLRAGLDSLLAREGFPEEVYEEVSTLIHQTYRLTGVVEDLLLLSRMDAGKLRLSLHTVDLSQLVDEWLDDLQAMPDAADLRVETDIPKGLQIAGEIKYTSLVVQNLLDNARKYNRPGGTIRISASRSGREVELRVKNSGRGIPAAEQPYIFERFHRAGASADVPGHGLGLNLARELVRLHGGELRLVISDSEWTEFSAVFRAAVPAPQTSTIVS